ncbi:transcription factor grauzone-like [Aedes albopictus]|uniref:C2H2-type domain-containing protein n=1 Tax=Aedes albopictus TaxID=7160 RepID=A0ABM1YBP2_AEDAL|nr:transcription factor grauzone-like [Aedes albopictus]
MDPQLQLLQRMVQQRRCLTCFDRTGEDARSTSDREVFQIVRKHLWFTETDLTESASICGGCWESIDGFHQFYVGAEQLYERKEVPFGLEGRIIKQETGSEVFLVEMARDDDMEIKEELGSDVEESDALKEELVGGETAGDVVEQIMMEEESEHDSEDDYEEDEDDADDKDDEGDDPDNFIKQHVVLNCDQCEASDFSFKGLVTHLQRIHNVVKCYVTCCGIRYHTRVRLLEHVKYITDPTSFKCDHCEEPQYFINVPALKRHKKLKHNIQVTTRLYNMENRLKKDKTPVEKTEEQLKKLEEQEKRRTDRAAEDKMMRDHVTFGCVPCGTTFETYTDLFRHSRIEHKQKPVVVCCGNRYHQRPRLLQHIQSVVNPTAFRCELCFRCFKSNYARNVHCAEMHPTEESVKFRCDRCPKVFVREIKYRKHMQDHEDCDRDQIKCEYCGKLYKSHHILYMHIRNKHKEPRFVCDICAKPFFLKSEFTKHKLEHENPEQLKMQCQHCLKWFKNRQYWRQHIRLHVVGEVKCEICGRITPNRVAYRSHKKNAHGDRTHKCDWCGKSFNKALTLREHVASKHTGATLYSCRFCPKTFNSNANMHSHQKKMHPVEWLAAKTSREREKARISEVAEFEEEEEEAFDT